MTGRRKIGVVMLQPACNMTCPFCITEDELGSLGFARAVEILETLAAEGVTNVVLGGGEPTLWKHDVYALAAEAKRRGFFVQLGTNGIRLPDGFERSDVVDRYVIPLDSTDPEVHDLLRPWSSSHHELILDRLARLKAAGKSTTVSTVVTRLNAGAALGVAEHLKAEDPAGEWIHALHLYRFIPRGRGGALHREELYVSREEFHAACAEVKARTWPFHVFRRTNMFESAAVDFAWMERGAVRRTSEDD